MYPVEIDKNKCRLLETRVFVVFSFASLSKRFFVIGILYSTRVDSNAFFFHRTYRKLLTRRIRV